MPTGWRYNEVEDRFVKKASAAVDRTYWKLLIAIPVCMLGSALLGYCLSIPTTGWLRQQNAVLSQQAEQWHDKANRYRVQAEEAIKIGEEQKAFIDEIMRIYKVK